MGAWGTRLCRIVDPLHRFILLYRYYIFIFSIIPSAQYMHNISSRYHVNGDIINPAMSESIFIEWTIYVILNTYLILTHSCLARIL